MTDVTDSEISARVALYAVERQELSSLMGHALTVIGAAVAYLGVAAALWTELEPSDWVLGALAMPAWAAVFFHALLNALVVSHNESVEILEKDLLAAARYQGADHSLVIGARPGRTVTDIAHLLKGDRLPLGIATLLAYGIPAGLLVAFSASCVVFIDDTVPAVVYLVVYVSFGILLGWIWGPIYNKIDADKLQKWARDDAHGSA